jgi:hypothetical protein
MIITTSKVERFVAAKQKQPRINKETGHSILIMAVKAFTQA